jgi:hypothetical protein
MSSFQEKARQIVYDYVKVRLEKTDKHVTFGLNEVYVVWWAKVLQNWKCLISTTLPDGMYYEVTYNGDKGETYLDAYKKFDNVCISD